MHDCVRCSWLPFFLRGMEEPSVHMIDHSPQPAVHDAVPVGDGHAWVSMPHDRIHCNLIVATSGNGLERMAERVDTDAWSSETQVIYSNLWG
jgi:hypothetical protein